DPAWLEPEDVVCNPEVVRAVRALQPSDFGGDVFSRPRRVPLTVDRLCTPVAVVRTATGCGDVHRKISVARCPNHPVAIDIYEVPRRPRERVEILDELAWRGSNDATVNGGETDAVNAGELPAAGAREAVERIDEGAFTFAGYDHLGPGIQIGGRVIAG